MRKSVLFGSDLSHRLMLSLPDALIDNRVTALGGRLVLVEGDVGLTECSETCMTLSLGRGIIRILGSGLTIRAMNGREILVEGTISEMEWN